MLLIVNIFITNKITIKQQRQPKITSGMARRSGLSVVQQAPDTLSGCARIASSLLECLERAGEAVARLGEGGIEDQRLHVASDRRIVAS